MLGRERIAVLVLGREEDAPFREWELARLVVPPAEDQLGRLVVVQEIAVGIDEEDRERELARDLLEEDQLDRLLRHRSLTPGRARIACHGRSSACTCCSGRTRTRRRRRPACGARGRARGAARGPSARSAKPSVERPLDGGEPVDAAEQDERHRQRGTELPRVREEVRLLERVLAEEPAREQLEARPQRGRERRGHLLDRRFAPEQEHAVLRTSCRR